MVGYERARDEEDPRAAQGLERGERPDHGQVRAARGSARRHRRAGRRAGRGYEGLSVSSQRAAPFWKRGIRCALRLAPPQAGLRHWPNINRRVCRGQFLWAEASAGCFLRCIRRRKKRIGVYSRRARRELCEMLQGAYDLKGHMPPVSYSSSALLSSARCTNAFSSETSAASRRMASRISGRCSRARSGVMSRPP